MLSVTREAYPDSACKSRTAERMDYADALVTMPNPRKPVMLLITGSEERYGDQQSPETFRQSAMRACSVSKCALDTSCSHCRLVNYFGFANQGDSLPEMRDRDPSESSHCTTHGILNAKCYMRCTKPFLAYGLEMNPSSNKKLVIASQYPGCIQVSSNKRVS